MTSQTTAIYFTGSHGGVWDDYTIGSVLTGGGSGTLTATAPILPNATSLTLNYNLSIEISAIAGAICVALSKINLIFPDGTVKNLYTVFYGGCTMPVMCTAPGGASGSVDLSSYISQYAGQSLTLEVEACGYPGSTDITWLMTAYLLETEIVTPATVKVNVTNASGPISGASVSMDDTTQNQTYTGTTDSAGNVTFTQMNLGDDVSMTVEATGMTTVKETISIDHTSNTVSVAMTSGLIGGLEASLASTGKYILVAAGVIGGIAVTYEVAKAVKNREKNIPYLEYKGQ